MADRAFSVKIFEIDREGKLQGLLSADEDYFAGTVPEVGDTYAKWGLEDVYTFFSVQRRIFIESPSAEHGWLVIVRQIDSAPLLETAAKEWNEDSEFWLEIELQEREHGVDRLAEQHGTFESWEAQSRERNKHRPLHRLDARLERILRFMIAHPEYTTVDAIPQAGEKTMEKLNKVGVVRPGGKDEEGNRVWLVTDEGRAEIERIETWTNWKFD